MSAYSTHFYGIDISAKYSDISEALQAELSSKGMKEGDPGVSEHRGKLSVDLSNYLEELKLGSSEYDGGGYGQITFIGIQAYSHRLGIGVTEQDAEKVDAMLKNLPPELDAAIRKAYAGQIPPAEFCVAEGWG